jgi:hypothetical protein
LFAAAPDVPPHVNHPVIQIARGATRGASASDAFDVVIPSMLDRQRFRAHV